MHQRTTVSAPAAALETLRAEALRRGVSLTSILAEAVEEKAAALRSGRKPRIGVSRSTDGLSAAETTNEPVAHPPL